MNPKDKKTYNSTWICNIYIDQNVISNSLYARLQQNMLEELQRLSGKKWTNFNVHDPGVTTGDIANYALTELDYKLGFEFIDYLTLEQTDFRPEKYGLFLPERVYPTTPVTLEDYRRLFLSHVPDLYNVVVELDESKRYHVKFQPSPFASGKQDQIKKKIEEVYHSNRNLCEMLGDVEESELTKLYLHSEVEIESGETASSVLAQIYWRIMTYLNGGIQFESFELLNKKDYSWEESLEGPKCGKRLTVLQQEDTMEELLDILSRIEGIKSFKTCYLSNRLENLDDIVTEFKEWYSLDIPQNQINLKVKIRVAGEEITGIDMEKFKKEVHALYMLNRSSTNPDGKNKEVEISRRFIPKGRYRNFFNSRSITQDFPACYRTEIDKSKPFGAYLGLFDSLLQKGLEELENVKELLSIESYEAKATPPSKIVEQGGEYRDIYSIKSQYLDLLDHLYGVESNQKWIQKSSNEEPRKTLERRMKFLRSIPFLLQTRSRSYNLTQPDSQSNVPTILIYLELLLGLLESDKPEVANKNEDVLSDVELAFNEGEVKHASLGIVESFSGQWVSCVFFVSAEPFTNLTFRKEIKSLVRSLLPAHLEVHVSWLPTEKYSFFRKLHEQWRVALVKGDIEEWKKTQKELEDMMRTATND